MRAARDLDLMLDGGLDQHPDQVLVLEQRALGDDRTGDLDLVQRQDVDERRRRPLGLGQTLGQGQADVALHIADDGEEDVGGGVVRGAARGLDQIGQTHQEPLAIIGRAASRERQKAIGRPRVGSGMGYVECGQGRLRGLAFSLAGGREEVVNEPETLTPITHGATLAGKALGGHWRTPWQTVRRSG